MDKVKKGRSFYHGVQTEYVNDQRKKTKTHKEVGKGYTINHCIWLEERLCVSIMVLTKVQMIDRSTQIMKDQGF